MEAIARLEDMVSVNDSSSNMHFYIGVLKTVCGMPNGAVESFSSAIEKSDDNYFLHYYWKGVALSMAGCYELALNEFEIAKNIDKSNFKASLCIGTCFLILGDLDNAYEAFKAVVGDPENEMEVNFCIGRFFMMRGFISHAIQSFQFAAKNQCEEKVLQELVKCYVCDKNLVSALDTYSKLAEMDSAGRRGYLFDAAVLEALKSSSEGGLEEAAESLEKLQAGRKEGFIFRRADLMVYIAAIAYLRQDYPKALKTLTLVEVEWYKQEEAGVLPQSEEESFSAMFISNGEREGQTFVSTKSVTRPELVYNIAMCLLHGRQFDKAYSKLSTLLEVPQIRGRVLKCLEFLKKWVSSETIAKCHGGNGNTEEKKNTSGTGSSMALKKSKEKILQKAFGEEEHIEEFEEDPNFNELSVFPIENRLCCIYPGFKVVFDEKTSVDVKLSFCLPFIEISDIKISVGYEELLKINLRSVEYKPEAPWIKKVDEKIIFTNHVVDEEVVEYDSPEELIKKMGTKSMKPVNTLIRMNVAHAYNHNIEQQKINQLKEDKHESSDSRRNHNSHDDAFEEDDGMEEEEGKPNLQKLKMELMLDDRTNELLKKMQDKKEKQGKPMGSSNRSR